MAAGRVLAIVNPRSAAGATSRRWPAVEATLRRALGPLEVEWTRAPRDAERIAREGVRAGIELLIVAGGDGTTGEVAAGLLGAGLGGYAEIALLPLGTGGDLSRGLALPRDLDAAVAAIARGKTRRLDAGRACFVGRDGRPLETHFVNISSFGVSGLVTDLVNRAPKALGGRVSFFIGTVRALARWRAVPVALRVDGELAHEGPLDLAVVANGSYFGGGMRVAPDARPDDGSFDVVAVRGATKARLLRKFPLLYRGRHLGLAEVGVRRGRRVEAEGLGGAEVFLEIDGEPLGKLPARYELLPGALMLRGVEA
jgi:YegS/Rv2252/BmrU family lipid kinase